jgi:hypothetical protein
MSGNGVMIGLMKIIIKRKEEEFQTLKDQRNPVIQECHISRKKLSVVAHFYVMTVIVQDIEMLDGWGLQWIQD